MMSPQEVQDKKFKTVLIGGYETAGIDIFMESLTDDYTALFADNTVLRKENAVLKNKLKVVAEKLEEYRAVDVDMRQTLLAAKKMAAEMIEEAQRARDDMLAQVQSDTASRRQELATQLAMEERRLEAAQKQTLAFVSQLRDLYSRQIEMMDAIPTLELQESKKTVRDKQTIAAVADIEKSLLDKIQPSQESLPESDGDETQTYEPAAAVRETVITQMEMLGDEEEDPEDITQRTMSIQQILRNSHVELSSDHLEDDSREEGLPFERDPDDTEVPVPRTAPPSDIDRFFGHTAE